MSQMNKYNLFLQQNIYYQYKLITSYFGFQKRQIQNIIIKGLYIIISKIFGSSISHTSLNIEMNQALQVLLTSKNQNERHQAEQYIDQELQNPIQAFQQLINIIELQNQLSFLAAAILHKNLRQRVKNSVILQCYSINKNEFSELLVRLLNQQAQKPNNQLDDIIALLLTYTISYPNNYTFPEIISFINEAKNQNDLNTQLHLATILSKQGHLSYTKIQNLFNFDIIQLFMDNLNALNQNSQSETQILNLKAIYIQGLANIVHKNQQILQRTLKQQIRRMCMETLVELLNVGEEYVTKVIEQLTGLYMDKDLDEKEKNICLEFVSSAIQSNFSYELKGAIMSLSVAIIYLADQEDTQIIGNFILDIVVPQIIVFINKVLIGELPNDQLMTNNFVTICTETIEVASDQYGGEFIIKLLNSANGKSKAHFLVILYQCFEYLNNQSDRVFIEQIYDQLLLDQNQYSNLEFYLCVKALVEMCFYQQLDYNKPYSRTVSALDLIHKFLTTPQLSKQIIWGIKFLINLMSETNQEVYFAICDKLQQIIMPLININDFESRALLIGIYSSIIVYEKRERFATIIQPVVPQFLSEYNNIYKYFTENPQAQLKHDKQEYLNRLMEFVYFIHLYYPQVLENDIQILFNQQLFILQCLIQTNQLQQVQHTLKTINYFLQVIHKQLQLHSNLKEFYNQSIQHLFSILIARIQVERDPLNYNEEEELKICLCGLVDQIDINPQSWAFCVNEFQQTLTNLFVVLHDTSLAVISSWVTLAKICAFMDQETAELYFDAIIEQLLLYTDNYTKQSQQFNSQAFNQIIDVINRLIKVVTKHYGGVQSENAKKIVLKAYDLLYSFYVGFQQAFNIEKNAAVTDKTQLQMKAEVDRLIQVFQDCYQEMAESYGLLFESLKGDTPQFVYENQSQLANMQFYMQIQDEFLENLTELELQEQCTLQVEVYIQMQQIKWGTQEQLFGALNDPQSGINRVIKVFLNKQCTHYFIVHNLFRFFIILCYALSFQLHPAIPIENLIKTAQEIVNQFPETQQYEGINLIGTCTLIALQALSENNEQSFYLNLQRIQIKEIGYFINNLMNNLYGMGTRQQEFYLVQEIIMPLGFGEQYNQIIQLATNKKKQITDILREHQDQLQPQSEFIANNLQHFLTYAQ